MQLDAEQTRRRDEEHLRLLVLFHYIVAGMLALVALLPVVHVTIGGLMLSGRIEPGDAPVELIGTLMVVGGALLFVLGETLAVLVLVAGRRIARRERRTFCLLVAGLQCLFQPFGTVLGVFTIVVLVRESVRELFEGGARPV